MLIKQIYTKCLAQASYYIECEDEAAVIDPIRDVDVYIQLAAEKGVNIQYVLLTHFHADFVSGHLELAQKTGARIILGPNAQPAYGAIIANDHDSILVGSHRIEVLHTPGHTIESTCFLLYNEDNIPHALFSGDTLFIGDVGRPDLLSGNLDAKTLADQLYHSLETKIKTLPDEVIVYPGHGAGSACGKNLARETWSTIGQQKASNYALKLNRDEFVNSISTNQPPAPAYFFKDAVINKTGYQPLEIVLEKGLKPLSAEEVKTGWKKGTQILDTRTGEEFGNCHIPGSIHIGLDGQYAIWVGTLIDFNTPLILVTHKGEEKQALIRLSRIGYENIVGYLSEGLPGWLNAKLPTTSVSSISYQELTQHTSKPYTIIDVRSKTEFESEKLPNTLNIPLNELKSTFTHLNKNLPYAVVCAGGYRSMIAASMMKQHGFTDVLNLHGGINAIKLEADLLLTA